MGIGIEDGTGLGPVDCKSMPIVTFGAISQLSLYQDIGRGRYHEHRQLLHATAITIIASTAIRPFNRMLGMYWG